MESTVVRPFATSTLKSAAAALVSVHASDGYPVEGVADLEGWIQSANVLAARVGEIQGRIVGHVSVM